MIIFIYLCESFLIVCLFILVVDSCIFVPHRLQEFFFGFFDNKTSLFSLLNRTFKFVFSRLIIFDEIMNKHLFSFYSLLFCLLLIPSSIKAQRFQLGVVGGLNLSELAGDDISSYIGLNTVFGLRFTVKNKKLYSYRGIWKKEVNNT